MKSSDHRSAAVDEAAAALYGAPYSGFTEERTRLSKALRAGGDKTAAAAVAKLPRPPMSAWVINRMYRDDRTDLDTLFEAAGRASAGDRDALEEHRTVLERLRARAAEILAGDGHAAAEATLRRVATTLRALAAQGSFEPDRAGQLLADRDPPGFEAMVGFAATAPRPALVREPDKKAGAPRPAGGAAQPAAGAANDNDDDDGIRERELAVARERRRQRDKERDRAAADLARLEDDAVAARRIAEASKRTLDELRLRLERAEASDADARTRLIELDDAIALAQNRLAELVDDEADDSSAD